MSFCSVVIFFIFFAILDLMSPVETEQDEGLEKLEESVTSTKHIALAVNEELNLHTRLIVCFLHVSAATFTLKVSSDQCNDVKAYIFFWFHAYRITWMNTWMLQTLVCRS